MCPLISYCLVALLSGTPNSQPTWLNVTLAEPETAVVARLGEVVLRPGQNGEILADYAVDEARGNEGVVFKNGYVISVYLWRNSWKNDLPTIADLTGISLKMNEAELMKKRPEGGVTNSNANGLRSVVFTEPSGATWTYEFRADKMQDISLDAPSASVATLPALPPLALHGGTSFEDALIDGATDESSGARNEENYVRTLRCDNNRHMWRESAQALANHNGRPYDILKLVCYGGGETRDLYFDITSFFGKL